VPLSHRLFLEHFNMFESFLSARKTIAHQDRDFVEWHSGTRFYGFWAVVIDWPEWIAFFNSAHAHVKRFIHQGYQRGPHITITACGLLDERHFSNVLLNRQLAAFKRSRIASFPLHIGPLDSFSSAPYISIQDPTDALHRIRNRLIATQNDDSLEHYQPHLTIGLYRDSFDATAVVDSLKAFQNPRPEPVTVSKLSFCAYETHTIQGPFRVLETVVLR
jgi:hypothetical protein